MIYKYRWKNQEANFGVPVESEIPGGTHISCENVLKFDGQYVALRRPETIPEHEAPTKAQGLKNGLLYFVHGLPNVETYLDTKQWAWTSYLIVEIDKLPTVGVYGNEVTEVVTFTKETLTDEFGWWTQKELEDFLKKYD